MTSTHFVHAADLERETGFSKDLLRKWRARYGFPVPVVTEDGVLRYPRDQIRQLRQIKRLLDTGLRPRQVVGLAPEELASRITALGSMGEVSWSPAVRQMLDLLGRHELRRLSAYLHEAQERQGLGDFIEQTVAPLTTALGEAWVRGEIEVYHEHLCSAILVRMMSALVGAATPRPGYPRIIFATPRHEAHILGLMMAQAVLADLGADCINIGADVPDGDLQMAVRGCGADIVALSFSFAYPAHRVRPLLTTLRASLPDKVELWIGGAGLASIRQLPPGIRAFSDFEEARIALREQVGTPASRPTLSAESTS